MGLFLSAVTTSFARGMGQALPFYYTSHFIGKHSFEMYIYKIAHV